MTHLSLVGTPSLSRLEFPYPKESPFRDRTAVVKTTNNPEYNHRSVIPANPKDKSFQVRQ